MTKNKKTLNRTLVPFREPRLRFGHEQALACQPARSMRVNFWIFFL